MGLSAKGAAVLGALACLATLPAGAADIVLLTTTNLKPIIDDVTRQFEAASGHHLVIDHAGAAPVKNRIAGGEAADVVMHSRFALDDLEKAGRLRAGTVRDIAHSSVGVAVKAGAAKPAAATLDQLKAALLAAASLATPDPAGGSLGGIYFTDLAQRLGIAEAIRAKLVLTGPATATAELVAKGGAALGIDQLTQFAQVSGLELVQPVPPELGLGIAMAAGIGSAAKQPEAALAWIAFLASSATEQAKRAHGMAP